MLNLIRFCVLYFVLASSTLSQAENRVSTIADTIKKRFESGSLYKEYKGKPAYNSEVFKADPKQAKVMFLIQGDALMQALEDGEFKNQHQTGYSGGGTFDTDTRYKLEEAMAGQKLQKLFPKIKERQEALPKYGMIEFADFAKHPKIQELWASEVRGTELDEYGEILVYLKDSVRNRTSMVPQDSGAFAIGGNIFADALHKQQQSLKQDRVLINFSHVNQGTFFEAQIWGKLTLDDIDYIVLPEMLFLDQTRLKMEQIRNALELSGIPVYLEKPKLSEKEKILDGLRLKTKGSLLYKENLKKRKTFWKTKACRDSFKRIIMPVKSEEDE